MIRCIRSEETRHQASSQCSLRHKLASSLPAGLSPARSDGSENTYYCFGFPPLYFLSGPSDNKIDVTGDELVVHPPAIRPIFHDYSDAPLPCDDMRCYSFAEILAEKIMALSDRARPRDLYDAMGRRSSAALGPKFLDEG